jgi:hypothetical protein
MAADEVWEHDDPRAAAAEVASAVSRNRPESLGAYGYESS